MPVVQCAQCGGNLKRDSWELRNNEQFFCGRICSSAWYKSKRIQAECANCGKQFDRPASHSKQTNLFCCRECRFQWQHKQHIEVQCAACSATLIKETAKANRVKLHFCNPRCKGDWLKIHQRGEKHWNWQGGLSTFVCEQCKEPFQRPRCRESDGEHHFCGTVCHNQWMKAHGTFSGAKNPNWKGGHVVVTCDTCGKTFDKEPCAIKTLNFCNRACMGQWKSQHQSGPNHPHWKGGEIFYRGPNWKQQAHAARQRDNYRCRHCRKTQKQNGRSLDVHHIKPFREFGYIPEQNDYYLQANDLTNLITLCRRCHKRAEWGMIPIQACLL